MRPRAWWIWLALVALVALLPALGYGVLYLLRDQGGSWSHAWYLLVVIPPSLAKALTIAVPAFAVAAALLTPLALAETRALRAYARREEELRRERPGATAVPYVGEEGEGVAFDGPDGRLLLLKPVAGVGAPREVWIPAPSTAPEGAGGAGSTVSPAS